jgi:transcriptional regulator with XRE-family HTH domain
VDMPPTTVTPNQIVAWNLARARALRGWTQEQAAERLAPYLGERWSKATYSAAERSVDGARVRQFTADDLHAFSRAFELPMTLFLTPPPWSGDEIGHAGGGETSTRAEYLDLVFDMPENARKRLLGEIVEFSAPTTRALGRWGANFAALVTERQRAVEALLATREDEG